MKIVREKVIGKNTVVQYELSTHFYTHAVYINGKETNETWDEAVYRLGREEG